MQNSYRMSIRNAPAMSVDARSMSLADVEQSGKNERLAFGSCFVLWMGMIASTWAAIAFVFSLI